MASNPSTRQRVEALRQLASSRRAEFAFGSKRKKAKTRRRLLTAAGIGLGATGLGLSVLAGRRGGSKGTSSSIATPAISSVAPKNVTAQSTVTSTPKQTSSQRMEIPVAPIVIPRAAGARKRQLNSQYVAEKKAAFLGNKTVADIRKGKKRFYNTQKVLTRRRDLGRAGYDLRDLQAKRQNLKSAIVNKNYGSRKELRRLGRDYARTSQRIAGAKQDVRRTQNPDLYRRLDQLESYLIASGRGRARR